MKLHSLHFNNLRSSRSVSIAPGAGGLWVTGPNGAGKSTVLDAVRWGLCNRTLNTDARGAGMARNVTDGADDAEIRLTLDTATITCHVAARGNQVEIRGPNGEPWDMGRDDFLRHVGIEPEHQKLCAMPELYLDNAGSVLGEYLAGDVSFPRVAEELAEWQVNWLRDYVGNRTLPPQTPADWLEVGKQAEADRRQAKKDLAALVVPEAAPIPADPRGKPYTAAQIPSIEKGVAQAQTKRDELLREEGAAGKARAKDVVEKALAKARTRHDKAAADCQTAADATAALQEGLRLFQSDLRSVMNEMSHGRQHVSDAESALESLTAAAESVATTCPTCGAELPETKVDEARQKLLLSIENARMKAESARESMQSLQERKDGLDVSMAEAKQAIADSQRREGELSPERVAARDAVDELESELRRASARSAESIAADLAETEAKIARGHELVAALRQNEERASAEKREHDLKVSIEHYDWVVKAFRDGEIINRLSGDRKGEFLERCNAELKPFGYRMDLEVSGKQVRVLIGTKVLRDVALCSEGERWLARFALAMAFSVTGAIVCLDDVNHLDGKHKQRVMQRLRKCEGTVIVAGAWAQSKDPDFPALAKAFHPAKLVWMEDGQARAIDGASEVAA